MKDVITEKVVGNFIIRTFYDECSESPREWYNLGTMVCFHKRYSLGDEHTYNHNDYNNWDEMKKDIIKNENVGVILPLYLYDHGGITISTSPFSCQWDSGQIGWIFVTKKKILEECGGKGKIVTKKLKERVTKCLENEVQKYDQYLQGEVYGVRVMEKSTCDKGHTHENEIHSCYGFYSEEDAIKDGMCYIN